MAIQSEWDVLVSKCIVVEAEYQRRLGRPYALKKGYPLLSRRVILGLQQGNLSVGQDISKMTKSIQKQQLTDKRHLIVIIAFDDEIAV